MLIGAKPVQHQEPHRGEPQQRKRAAVSTVDDIWRFQNQFADPVIGVMASATATPVPSEKPQATIRSGA